MMEERNFVENLRSVKAMYDGAWKTQKGQPVEPSPKEEDNAYAAKTKGVPGPHS